MRTHGRHLIWMALAALLGSTTLGCGPPASAPTCTNNQGASETEPNDTVLTADPITSGTAFNGALCPGDQDFYAISVSIGATIDLSLTYVMADGDIDVELRHDSGVVEASSLGTTGTETINFLADATEMLYVRVFFAAGTQVARAGNTYAATVTVLP